MSVTSSRKSLCLILDSANSFSKFPTFFSPDLPTIYSFPEVKHLERNSLLTTIDLGKEWEVSFLFYPDHFWNGGFIAISQDLTKPSAYGFKIMFHPYKLMHVKFQGNNTEIHKDFLPLPPKNQWTSITASQTKTGILTIMLGGVWQKSYTSENPHTQEFREMNVYASDPWSIATPGYICGLTIKSQ